MASELATLFLSFPPKTSASWSLAEYDKHIKAFVKSLSQLEGTKALEREQKLLDVLDPAENSLPYLVLLLSKIETTCGKNFKSAKTFPDTMRFGGALSNQIGRFLNNFDPVQIRYCGAEWRRVIEYVAQVAAVTEQAHAGALWVRDAMLRLDASTGTFTSSHLLFLRLCMESRQYRAAMPILDNLIHSFPGVRTSDGELSLPCADHPLSNGFITAASGFSDKLHARDIQEYFLLGAMAYLSVQRYKDALLFLEHVLTVPTQNVANGFILEAYRKWLMVGCLVDGNIPSMPRTANGHAMKTVRSASKAYAALADDFQARNMPKLKADVEAGGLMWREDGNEGLVQQLLRHLPRFYITNLQKTFAVVPLAKVAEWLGEPIDQTEAYLHSLVAAKYLNATIEREGDSVSEKPPILRFFADSSAGPLAKSEQQQFDDLVSRTQRTKLLTEQVRAAEHRLALTREYAEDLRKRAANKPGNGGGGPGDSMEFGWGVDAPEEDVMGD